MGGASQGTPTPMMSPAPPGGPQDMAGYGMGINGSDYGSQPYNDGSMGYDPMHQVKRIRKKDDFDNNRVERPISKVPNPKSILPHK